MSPGFWASFTSSSSSVICQTTGPKPLPTRTLHIQVVRCRASSFNWQYPVLSLRPSSSFLRLLPRLLVTSICPFIIPSITCCRRQFLHKMWPIQFAFRFLISCRIFLCSLTVSNTSSFLTWSVQLIFSILLQHHISKLSRGLRSKKKRLVRTPLPHVVRHWPCMSDQTVCWVFMKFSKGVLCKHLSSCHEFSWKPVGVAVVLCTYGRKWISARKFHI